MEGDNNKRLTCPYNKYHTFRPTREASHLLKCQKAHPGQVVRRCRWNEYHAVFEMELEYHEAQCASRNAPMGHYKERPKAPKLPYHKELMEEGEDWTEEMDTVRKAGHEPFSYPRLDQDKFIDYTKKHMTRTEQLVWRKQQRESFQSHVSKNSYWVTSPPSELLGTDSASSVTGSTQTEEGMPSFY